LFVKVGRKLKKHWCSSTSCVHKTTIYTLWWTNSLL